MVWQPLPETAEDSPDDGFGRFADIDRDGIAGFLERRELTGKKIRRHEMSIPLREAVANELEGAFQVYEKHFAMSARKALSIDVPQRRTGDDGAALFFYGPFDQLGDSFDPRLPVGIGQRLMPRHFRDIPFGMEIVPVEERPAERFGEPPADGGFAGARDADEHNDDDRGIHDAA